MLPDATTHKKLRNSCDFCTEAKLKCNQAKPSCRRCIHRGQSCVYSHARRVGRPPKSLDQRRNSGQVNDAISSSALTRSLQDEPAASNQIATPPHSTAHERTTPSVSNSLDLQLDAILDYDLSSTALLEDYNLSLDGFDNFDFHGDIHMSGDLGSPPFLENLDANQSSPGLRSELMPALPEPSIRSNIEKSFQQHEEAISTPKTPRINGLPQNFGHFDSILSPPAISALNASISSFINSDVSDFVLSRRSDPTTTDYCSCLALLIRLLFIVNHPSLYQEENAAFDLVLFLEQSTRKGKEAVAACPKCLGRSSSFTLIIGIVVEWIVEKFVSALESESSSGRRGSSSQIGEWNNHGLALSHAETSVQLCESEMIRVGSFTVRNEIRLVCKVELLKIRLTKLADMLKAMLESCDTDRSSCLGKAAGLVVRDLYDRVERAFGMIELREF